MECNVVMSFDIRVAATYGRACTNIIKGFKTTIGSGYEHKRSRGSLRISSNSRRNFNSIYFIVKIDDALAFDSNYTLPNAKRLHDSKLTFYFFFRLARAKVLRIRRVTDEIFLVLVYFIAKNGS